MKCGSLSQVMVQAVSGQKVVNSPLAHRMALGASWIQSSPDHPGSVRGQNASLTQ